jgi:plasmid stabilization system protein ParE
MDASSRIGIMAILSTPYWVIDRVKGRRVKILRVLHGSRKYP